MRIQLEVQNGPDAGKVLVVEAGRTAVVGRRAPCALVLEHDTTVSRQHFAVDYTDRRQCRLYDLKSMHGTRVNGRLITEVLLQDRDVIEIGWTRLVVHFESESAPRVRAAIPAPAAAAAVSGGEATLELRMGAGDPDAEEDALRVLQRLDNPLFAVLDAARDPRIYPFLFGGDERYESLYEGPQAADLNLVAPYLVALPPPAPRLEGLLQMGWGHAWGFYLTSRQPFDAIRKHLRRFLTVELPGGAPALFRFYDPRVLRVFLPSCSPAEYAGFMRPFEAILVEDEEGRLPVEFVPAASHVSPSG